MVLTDSHGISRAPCYLGSPSRRHDISTTGLSPSVVSLSKLFVYIVPVTLVDRQIDTRGPTTPTMQRLPAITHDRFGLFRFRSPLLTESRLFSFPVGTEMFHFPTFPPTALCVQAEVAGHDSGISRFPYSEIHGSKLVYQLPMAYRRLQRPSSAPSAKASTLCP